MSETWAMLSTTSAPSLEPVSEYIWLVCLGGLVCFCMAWGIGANDVANAFATSVGAKAISIKQAVIIAAIFEFSGALALGATVTDTIRKKITDYDAFKGEGDVLMLGMFCSLCSSALWLFIATRYQLPVSTTQSIVGAIIGFVVMAKGPQAVVWEQVMWIAIFWVASPVLSAIGSILLFLPSRTFLFRRSDSYEKTLLTWPFWVFLVFFVMILFVLMKGLKRFDLDLDLATAALIAIACGVLIAFIAWIVFIKFGLVDKFVQSNINPKREEIDLSEKNNQKEMAIKDDKSSPTADEDEEEEEEEESAETSISQELVAKSEQTGKKNSMHIALETNCEAQSKAKMENKSTSRLKAFAQKATYGMTVDITREDDMDELERAIHADSEKFDRRTERAFSWLQVCTAALDIFAHGSNDVANAVAPFAAMVAIFETESISKKSMVPLWVLLIGACGMTIGLATYGYKIMQTLGVRMGAMSSTRGYSIELSSALVVILASYYGMPASTTHAQVGATVGVGLCELTRGNESKLTWKQVINWRLLAQVFAGWILTLIVAAATCAALFGLLAYSPHADA
eukprot:CAMPEP_0197020714 /NCGR_PEP_ID=MMETSP1384-20130603/1572_1 /TAXON_ID=29189 /ORGANISM="Ammonia sp." /LENGTH=569 /DNA_ID=CAMNT_0042448393 /DNA_START=40 /DNA_END=1749 /DNA_ORIENTATION=+